jgi:hypothetical protein
MIDDQSTFSPIVAVVAFIAPLDKNWTNPTLEKIRARALV